jgi:hypothetical protein
VASKKEKHAVDDFFVFPAKNLVANPAWFWKGLLDPSIFG